MILLHAYCIKYNTFIKDIKWYQPLGAKPGRSKATLNEVIMISLQGVKKRSDEGYFDKLLIFILVKEILLYTGQSSLGAHLVPLDIE